MLTLLHAGERPEGLPITRPAGVDEVLGWHVGLGREVLQQDVDLPESVVVNPGRAEDLALLMFTSGTTGLPKAARITNRRWAMAALGAAASCRLTPRDTVYCCLPLHHSTGQLVAVGGALVGGARLALAEKFSVRSFWSEVRHVGATVVVYVGELCRYLTKAPVQDGEGNHPVRLLVGNGMRPEVWQAVLERFGPVRIVEFYGSTEGNAVLANMSGDKPGSVGRPVWHSGELALARYDVASGELLRQPDGFAARCEADEPGLLLARVGTEHPSEFFDGYVSREASDSKLMRGVFAADDVWFNSGDLLRADADGDYWFVDRVGDTFRWKGENVSTEQVAAVLARSPHVAMVAVYGVELAHREGRAGMAAIELTPGSAFDGAEMFQRVTDNLFDAARPRFIRVTEELELTDSLKVKKAVLGAEGADPARIADAVYHLDTENETYTRLTPDAHRRLMSMA